MTRFALGTAFGLILAGGAFAGLLQFDCDAIYTRAGFIECMDRQLIPGHYEQVKAIEKAKAYLSKILNDPYSARFEDVYVRKFADDRYVCGDVNAKNGFGAYVGRRRFAFMESKEIGWVSPDEERNSGTGWADICTHEPIPPPSLVELTIIELLVYSSNLKR